MFDPENVDTRHQTGYLIIKMATALDPSHGFREPLISYEQAREMLSVVYPEFREIF